MPSGASPKRERQYKHIKQSAKKSGRSGSSKSQPAKTLTKGSRTRKSTTATPRRRASSTRRSSTRGRGFAGMSEQRQREIAAAGGRAAHKRGTAHEFSSSEARRAGQKGGEAVSRDRSHMAKIGRKGGER
jgi:uncharacterized protein